MKMQIGRYNFTTVHATIAAMIFESVLLGWEYLHGGVGGHYVLQQKSLPFVSNWLGLLLLPALTWILWSRIEKRLAEKSSAKGLSGTALLFVLGLALGVLISVSFLNEYNFFLDNVLYIPLIISLIFPIYYSEFMLGLVVGMVTIFGVVLPTAFMLIIASVGFLIYRFIRIPILKKIR
ncbi:MAG: hypothetical protein ACKO96_22475 [Flammeovirgaceae bacterium]